MGTKAVQEEKFWVHSYDSEDRIPFVRDAVEQFAKRAKGKLAESLPPFVVACTDGVLLVFHVTRAKELQSASAVLLPAEFDYSGSPLGQFWRKAEKLRTSEQTMRAFGLSAG